MMKKLFAIAVIAVAGCATQGGYEPTVDTYNDPNASRLSQDQYECRQLALQASGGTATETAKGTVVGGLIGAAAGAAIGAAAGDPGKGAAIGAAGGGIGGGAKQGIGAEEEFKRAYQNCLRNRGHNVID